MEKNLLNNYVFALLESVEQNLSAYTKEKKPEHLHRLRVDLKKTNAILSFAEKVFKEQYDGAKLKPIFRKAGKIREMHLNIQMLNAVPNPPKRLITQLKKNENMLVQQFSKNVSGYITVIKKFCENVCLPEKLISKKNIVKYFNKEKRKANKILKSKNREDMHRYRKKIKKLMFIYNAIPKAIQNKIELNKAEIDKHQNKLGNWHDIYSAMNYFSHKQMPKKTSEYLIKLKEKEKSQFNALLLLKTSV